MANVNRPNRKASDSDILRMNYVGMSLGTIAKTLGIHPTTVTLRLQNLGVYPADTRRTFMENVLKPMPEDVAEWLADQLGPTYQIREFVRDLLQAAYDKRFDNQRTAYERHLAKYGGVVPPSIAHTFRPEPEHADGGALRGSPGNDPGTDAPDSGSGCDPQGGECSPGEPASPAEA
ncbi:hypothetical protein JJJA_0049 [Achromobacter phage JWDelta]|uniref:Uncharacterized protein n=2 Tax=Jwalphavirus jwalpha TaxID=2169963 RepID=V9VF86_9CAUD|nr:hypothetical protein CH29_gp52 [Achromobacter phage JWAlpha]AHC56565.1 hypothetical protein JJJA_0049 [Achromobacter phage JWDelta]AHC94005.1 hypothetical protein JJJB_0052 [Achromobacter phage JWAlpha]